MISASLRGRLVRAHNARARIEHGYVQIPAGDVHRAAMLVRDAARDFITSYRTWIAPHLAEPESLTSPGRTSLVA